MQLEARWEGEVEVDGVRAKVAFEVFESGRKWDFLSRKPLLETFMEVHDYERDEIILKEDNTATHRNQVCTSCDQTKPPETPISIVTEET